MERWKDMMDNKKAKRLSKELIKNEIIGFHNYRRSFRK